MLSMPHASPPHTTCFVDLQLQLPVVLSFFFLSSLLYCPSSPDPTASL